MIRPLDPAALADTEALNRLVAAYSRAIDRRDFAALRALYLPEGTDNHGKDFDGAIDGYVAYVQRALSAYAATAHYVAQAAFVITGDRAEGEVHKINYHRTIGADPRHVITGSRSLDHYARRDGAWFFASRHVVIDWVDRRAADPADWGDPAAGSERGQPDKTDASYRVIPGFARAMSQRETP